MSQFEQVSSRYGAPMGRREDGYLETRVKRFVRLFRVRINSGGYDDGGAYWGIGEPLYCAIDGDGSRKFTRAPSRFLAAVKLGIPVPALKSGLPGWAHRCRHYAENPAMLTLHGIGRADFVEWARWSGVAKGQNPADYQWGAA